jgi:hypothetical protein
MADDEKIIRIEGRIDEERAPEPSAGDKLRDQESASANVLNREDYDRLAEDRLHWETIEKIVHDIRMEEDKPLFGEEPPVIQNIPMGPVDQLPAFKEFGDQELKRGEAATSRSAEDAEIDELLAGFKSLNAANTAKTVAGATAVAAGTEGIGGGGATVAGGGTAVAAGATATAVGSTLGPLGLAAIGVAASFAALTAVVVVLEELLDSIFQALHAEWNDISANIAAAEGRREAELTLARLETEDTVGPAAASVTEARTEVDKEIIEIKAILIERIAPILVALLKIAEVLLTIIKVILTVLNTIARIIGLIWKPIEWLARKFGWLGDDDDPQDKLAKEFTQLLNQPITETNKDPRGSFPRPHAGRTYKGTL